MIKTPGVGFVDAQNWYALKWINQKNDISSLFLKEFLLKPIKFLKRELKFWFQLKSDW